MAEIRDKNFSFSGSSKQGSPPTYELTEATHCIRCNFTAARVQTNGYAFTRTECNEHGLYIDGVKQDSYVWQDKEPLPLAVSIRERIAQSGGQDGVDAWDFAVETILADPTTNQAAWEAKQAAWAAKSGAYSGRTGKKNMLIPNIALERITATFFVGQSFEDIRDVIKNHSAETWRGDSTQVLEEVS